MSALDNKVPIDTTNPIPLNSWLEFHEAEAEWAKRIRQADIEGCAMDIDKYTAEDKQLIRRIGLWILAHKPIVKKPDYCACKRIRGSYMKRSIDGVCLICGKTIKKLK
jgi:hypothetical protein